MHRLRRYVLLAAFLLSFQCLLAQENSGGNALTAQPPIVSPPPQAAPFVVRNIIITGNRKTKASVILRELPFKKGDRFPLPELVARFDAAKRQLMNTSLFHEVVVALKSFEGSDVDISINVKERWYIFPIPYLKMVDRNLNQWIVQNHASLSRVNYGLKLMYNNVTGYNDKLNLWFMGGYTQQVIMSYDRLYLDKHMKWGARAGLALGRNKEVNYNTINDREVFYKDTNNFIRSFFKPYFEFTFRPAINTRHRFGIAYTVETVDDTVMKLNPSYFPADRKRVSYPEIYYNMRFHDVDYIPYPLQGFEAQVRLTKKGLNHGMNAWEFNLSTGNYWELFSKTYLSVKTMSAIKLPLKQPFFNKKLLGYGEMFIPGYEYYVVDGTAGGFLQTTFSRHLVTWNVPIPNFMSKKMDYIPFRIYSKIYGNAGYVYNEQPGANRLSNKMLYSGGLGVDIVTLYDVSIRVEWSFNQLGQNAIYLHRSIFF